MARKQSAITTKKPRPLGLITPIEVENIAPEVEAVVPLNFRVPPEFRRRFKVMAAQRGILMTALLKETFEEWILSHSQRQRK